MEQDKIRIAVGTKYSITGTIGRGGMGTVYSAIAKGLNRPVAIKVVVAEDDETKTRFVAETSALSRLHHQNILPLLDSGESEQLLYYVMPLVEGKSLEAILLSCRRLAIPQALSVADAVASALSEAHGHGIIHRDLKPSNILIPIDEEGPHYDKAMVADFSVVGTLRTHTRTTRVGQFYGTPRYMSPEQIKGEAQSTATDVYGLGLLLYEMIFGQSPFDEANDALTLMQLTLTKEVKIPESPRIPEPLEIFLQACLSKEPDRRPKNPSVELLRLRASIGEATAVQTRRVGSSVESPKSSPATGSVVRMVIGSAVFLLSTVVGIGLLIPSKDRQLVVDVAIGFSLVAVGILSAIFD
jgi:serine/threonine-protein kinase